MRPVNTRTENKSTGIGTFTSNAPNTSSTSNAHTLIAHDTGTRARGLDRRVV